MIAIIEKTTLRSDFFLDRDERFGMPDYVGSKVVPDFFFLIRFHAGDYTHVYNDQ